MRKTITVLFDTFTRTGSAMATVKAFRKEGMLFPRRSNPRGRVSEVIWGELTHTRILQILHNPRYAGAFMFGRTRSRRRPDGTLAYRRVPLEENDVLLRDQHEGYISWERFEANRQRLKDNSTSGGGDRRPPRAAATDPGKPDFVNVSNPIIAIPSIRNLSGARRPVPGRTCDKEEPRSGRANNHSE